VECHLLCEGNGEGNKASRKRSVPDGFPRIVYRVEADRLVAIFHMATCGLERKSLQMLQWVCSSPRETPLSSLFCCVVIITSYFYKDATPALCDPFTLTSQGFYNNYYYLLGI